MHIYLRLLNSSSIECYSPQEKQHLHELLSAAPGVEKVKTLQQHDKGGYAVTLDLVRESLDEFMQYLPAHGLRPVM